MSAIFPQRFRIETTTMVTHVLSYSASRSAVWLVSTSCLINACACAWAVDASALQFSVVPAKSGLQLVRVAMPFPRGEIKAGDGLTIDDGRQQMAAAVRPLGWHWGEAAAPSVRVGLVTFPYEFTSRSEIRLHGKRSNSNPTTMINPALRVDKVDDGWQISDAAGPRCQIRPLWPEAGAAANWQTELVEDNAYFRWQRWTQSDEDWTRIVECRFDPLGQIVAVAHLQRKNEQDDWATDFGWELTEVLSDDDQQQREKHVNEITKLWKLRHSYTPGHPYGYLLQRRQLRVSHPAAPLKRCGAIFTKELDSGAIVYRYLRSTPQARVPMQPYSWRRAEMVIAPTSLAPVTALLASPHRVSISAPDWNKCYDAEPSFQLNEHPWLNEAVRFHRDALVTSVMVGHDWGNLSGHIDGQSHGALFGMNRLNHAPALMMFGLQRGDRALVDAALGWCDNFHDLTIWWGPKLLGGTRYPSRRLGDNPVPEDNTTFTWRGNRSKDFCTKGYAAFQLAYEQTGDPRMKEALAAQIEYAQQHVHADDGECRNIGDVADFVLLYELTGEQSYLDHALRLFRELRTVLSTDLLFSQDGEPIVERPSYIDEDEMGRKFPYPKPYIIGYALAGCPRLAEYAADEPKLAALVEAVADFLASSQDPAGGWRYPHQNSSRLILSQAIEHAWQLVQAAKLIGPKHSYLDAIERTLRQRLWVWQTTGKIAGNLSGWEISTGHIGHPLEIYSLYKFPADRDPARDYREGRLGLGGSATEGLVYFPEVLAYYLEHRPVAGLTEKPTADSPLGQMLANVADQRSTILKSEVHVSSNTNVRQTVGVQEELPVFTKAVLDRTTFPLAWQNNSHVAFDEWRTTARAHVRKSFLAAPAEADFAAEVTASQQRDGYTAHQLEFNISGESRVLAYLLVPDGAGPFPAVLLLHDHGAEFRIGKEKVIRPWGIPGDKQELAQQWIDKYYGGRFLGDELAQRGYVCLATDALNWSDRGGGGFDGQQALASNLMHLGMSLAGLIAQEDLRAVEYLSRRPEVDRRRVAAMGLSMGGFRTWQLAAMTDRIAAGAAICWMSTVEGLMQPGNNQTHGHSSYTMLHPGLLDDLDYPDVASLACPKPMLFYNGRQDHLFPVPGVEEAYQKMRAVWTSQRREESLETRLWDVRHVFNQEMQAAVFQWLDKQLQHTPLSP
ncbi:MAG: dienelactone hydrolase family protein [Bythopirellula sp.]